MGPSIEIVATGSRRASRWPLIAGLSVAHFLLSLALVYWVRQTGTGPGGGTERPLGDVLLAGAFHAVTLPVLIVRTLLPLWRAPLFDALLIAASSLGYGVAFSALVVKLRAAWRRDG